MHNKHYLFRTLRESKVTSTLVSSRRVGAGSVATDPGVGSALVSVHTHQPRLVQRVARWTLAAEGAIRVDTATALTNVGADLTLV